MDFDKSFTDMMDVKVVSNGVIEIRPSSMPFCPRKLIIDFASIQENSYRREFYTRSGTNIHSLFQRWFPLAKESRFFGNWKCNICERVIYREYGPSVCCGYPMEYKEVWFKCYDMPMRGYLDGIIINESKGKKTAWVIELKSTSRFNAPKLNAPYLKHTQQATLCTQAIRKVFKEIYKINDIEFKGYKIKYLSRDDPSIVSRTFTSEVPDDKLYKMTCKTVNKTIETILKKKTTYILDSRMCKSNPHIYLDCDHTDFCFRDDKVFIKLYKSCREEMISSLRMRTINIFD